MKNTAKHCICLAMWMVLLGAFCGQCLSQTNVFATADYRNVIYDPSPSIAGVDNTQLQAKSISIFGGNVGVASGPNTPRSGDIFLVRSAFGFPVAPTPPTDFIKFGAEIPPPQGADVSKAPEVKPATGAFFLPETRQLIASDPGYTTVIWSLIGGGSASKSFFIDNQPIRTPMVLYHTHNSSVNFTNPPAVPPEASLRRISIPGSQITLDWKWNTQIPFDPLNPAVTNNSGGELIAHSVSGLVCLVVRKNGVLEGYEIVSVKPVAPDGSPTLVDIGSQLLPFVVFTNSLADVSAGVEQTDPNSGFLFPFGGNPVPHYAQVYAIKKSLEPAGADMEIYWRHQSFGGISWTYELHRYRADWPADVAKYQIYVRGSDAEWGLDVQLPTTLRAEPMPFREAIAPSSIHSAKLVNNLFSTTGSGWSLLKYSPDSKTLRFQVVRSVLHNDTTQLGALTASDWEIGREISEPNHKGPRRGYVFLPEGDRYDWETYDDVGERGSDWQSDWTTKQIFGVNTGLLEVWWSTVDSNGIQWPSFVRRYNQVWPSSPERIVIASTEGSGVIDEANFRNMRLYVQNNPKGPGFNPNDEHASILNSNRRDGKTADGSSVFALRDDLGGTSTSLPYALLKGRDGSGQWRFRVFQVLAEDSQFKFSYDGKVGNDPIQPPYPLKLLQIAPENYGVSGPFWKSRKLELWARAAGDDGGSVDIVLRFFYPSQPGFYFPDSYFPNFPAGTTPTNLPPAGTRFAWLDRRPGGVPKQPTDIRYVINWPADLPALRLGETLVTAKRGLPNITDQTSAEVLYDQAVALGQKSKNVKLIDPINMVVIPNVDLSAVSDLAKEVDKGITRFVQLPPHLRSRIGYNPDEQTLSLVGEFVVPTAGESYLLLNTLSAREVEVLNGLSVASAWRNAVISLATAASSVKELTPNTPFAAMALTAGDAKSSGFVTLAFGNSTNLTPTADPVSLAVIRVDCPRYQGELKTILPEGPLDEKLTMRFAGDFAGRSDGYVFEWKTMPPDASGLPPTGIPRESWSSYTPKVASGLEPGQGALDITIEGAGLFTLSDNYFVCRYRPLVHGDTCVDWSDWTAPMLAPGWIKRALQAINPFEQRIKDFSKHVPNTLVSMIGQAGTRYHGSIPFNNEALNKFGLIEIYESILKRGIGFSIDGTPAVSYGPANDALLLAAGRISDLYMLLGNEAYADASDPTIGFGTDGQYGAEATEIHSFMNQTASLIDEELALLRGRDDHLQPAVSEPPFHNRLIWNFTKDKGEVAYAENYNIRGRTNFLEAEAKTLYPQGHGDAWGHYLSALKGYYKLLLNPNFSWVPRPEAVLVGGVPVSVDFLDERKFATAAAAKARTGAEIVSLTYRNDYSEDPNLQWQGYPDSDAQRAWGISEWGSRAGMGAYFDWVLGNALLPASSAKKGIEKIDRTTVLELREIPAAFDGIQAEVDKADHGLNPLGLAKNVVPFDIDPNLVLNPQGGSVAKTHFEQIYDRAVGAMNNAIAVFNHANSSTQLLRRQADSLFEFQKNFNDREADLNSRLIEAFGYPYTDDIGAGKTYPQGYDGPDLYHYMYSDPSLLLGETKYTARAFTMGVGVSFFDATTGVLAKTTNQVTFHMSSSGFGLVKPPEWRGQRRAPGEIQRAHGELLQAKGRFDRAQVEYDNLLAQIEDQVDQLRLQSRLNADEISLLNSGQGTQQSLNSAIRRSRQLQLEFQTKGRMAGIVANAVSEGLPKTAGIIAGLANGVIADFLSGVRSAIQLAGTVVTEIATREANQESLAELDQQQAKEGASAANNIQLTSLRQESGIQQQLKQIEQLVRQEASLRLELYGMQESMVQSAGNYQAALARAERLLEDRDRFRQESASEIQTRRYNDMAFRIFRNEALQKYRAQFDMAALYVYLAAKAYDFETNLRPSDQAGPGRDFMEQIVHARTIGLITSGIPQTGTRGDSGLADPMARMSADFQVLKTQLGFNNPQTAKREISLRSELFRVLPTNSVAAAGQAWRDTLARQVVPNISDIPEFKRYCLFQGSQANEPGFVIKFGTTIDQNLNLFGWPGGSPFNPTAFSTKIRSVGVSFSNFKTSGGGKLNEIVYVYLVPIGSDIMRSPRASGTDDINFIRTWRIQDQWLPVPYPLGIKNDPKLTGSNYVPIFNLLGSAQFSDVRGHASFQAFHDSLSASPDSTDFQETGLIGRSVWNTQWMLVIPAVNLLVDRNEGIQRFIYGGLNNGKRDNDGVSDIRIQFRAYSYTGR